MGQHSLPDPIEAGAPANVARFVTEHDTAMFTGPLLARYQEAHRLDERALAGFLGCSEGDLVQLALCGRPRPDQFESDISRIAAHVHAQEEALLDFYREMTALPAQPKKVYRGWWEGGDWHVTVNGEPLLAIGFHCPDGFAWGYDGSACTELALCLLRDHLREWHVTKAYLMEQRKVWSLAPRCWELRLAFREAFVARWGQRESWE